MSEEKYLLEAKYNNEIHTFEIENIEQVNANFENYIAETTMLVPTEITNEDEKKIVKKARTEINKKLKELKDGRITINNLVIGTFNDQVKGLEKSLDNKSKELSNLLDNYEPKEKKWTLKGFSTNKDQLEQIQKYALDQFQIELKIE